MIASALALPERFPGRTIAALGVAIAVAYLAGTAWLKKTDGRVIVGDAVHYYVYVRSAVFDRDLQFRNDYVRMYRLTGNEPKIGWIYQPTATGHVRNLMPVGPAILWTPLFLAAVAVSALARAAGAPVDVDGFGTICQLSAALSGIIAAALGARFTYKLCAIAFERRTAIWSTLTVWIGSSALYYSLVSPAYSHAASMLAASVFLYVWGVSIGDERPTRFVRIGLCAGLAALVRWQDAVLLVAPAIEMAWMAFVRRPLLPLGRAFAQFALCGASAALAFLPQNVVWLVLYGTPFTVPQGGEFMKWMQPALLRVLVSDWHGLFSWTPIALVGIVGLLLRPIAPTGPRAARPEIGVLMFGALGVFLLSWYVNAAVADWWAGEAFGARRFVSCFPVFTLGVAALGRRLAARPGWALGAAAALCCSNVLLLVQYQLFMHGQRAPYPAGVYGMTVERFVLPLQMALNWWRR